MSILDATLYVERRPLQTEAVLDVLHYLWTHGADFVTEPDVYGGSWDGLLQTGGGALWGRYAGMTFGDMIRTIVAQGSGAVPLLDRRTGLRLLLDTNLGALADSVDDPSRVEDLPFGRLVLSVESFYLDSGTRIPPSAESPATGTYIPPHAYLLSPYTQVHYAVLHWVELLCRKLEPSFGFSVDTDGLAKGESEFYRHVDVAFMRALREGQVPPIHEWLRRPEILYVSPRLVSSTLTSQWLSTDGRWAHILPSGGLLSYALPALYETTIAEDLIRQGNALFESGARSSSRALYQRARAIFEALGDRANARRCDVLIAGVERGETTTA